MIYKTFQKVSNVCQVLDKRTHPSSGTNNGITFTHNGDGSYTANGTFNSSSGSYFYFCNFEHKNVVKLVANHKYLVLNGTYYEAGKYSVWLIVGNQLKADSNGTLFANEYYFKTYTPKKNEEASLSMDINHKPNVDTINFTFKPQLFDLTEMYGAGNEPTSVEQFRQDFPEEMYDYKPYCFVKSYRTLLKASDYCQLLDKSKYPATATIAGVTFTNNGDGTITANGTSTYSINMIIFDGFPIKKNHKYLILDCTGSTSRKKYSTWLKSKIGAIVCDSADKPIGNLTYNDDKGIVYVRVENGITVSNLTFKPQLFDLTEMYGAGHEPTTVEQFKADFPNELYDYKPYSTIPSYKKSLACKTKNLFDISKLSAYTPETLPQGTAGVYNGNIIARASAGDSTSGSTKTLKELCPNIEAGKTYTVHFNTTATGTQAQRIYLRGADPGKGIWYNGESRIVSVNDLAAIVTFYANYPELTVAAISNFQIELGSTVTEYHPYGYL